MDNSYIIIYVSIAVIILVGFIFAIYSHTKKVSRNAATQKTRSVEVEKDETVLTKVLISTVKGEILLELRQDLMPYTVNNFVRLIRSGFYNGLIFHRIEPFLIQTGDPTTRGLAAPKWSLKLETHKELEHRKYTVGMASSKGNKSATTQFYILKRDVKSFDGQFAIFGKVISGFEVIEKIEKGDVMNSIKVLT